MHKSTRTIHAIIANTTQKRCVFRVLQKAVEEGDLLRSKSSGTVQKYSELKLLPNLMCLSSILGICRCDWDAEPRHFVGSGRVPRGLGSYTIETVVTLCSIDNGFVVHKFLHWLPMKLSQNRLDVVWHISLHCGFHITSKTVVNVCFLYFLGKLLLSKV